MFIVKLFFLIFILYIFIINAFSSKVIIETFINPNHMECPSVYEQNIKKILSKIKSVWNIKSYDKYNLSQY